MDAIVIDAFEFCRRKQHAQGEIPVADLARLAAESADGTGMVRWSLQGGSDIRGNAQLTLSVSGAVRLRCQRCLGDFPCDMASQSVLVLAADEGGANELDELLQDEEVEVIVGSRAMDIVALIEDEALLALPSAPKHDVCPDRSLMEKVAEERKESPFAALKNFKQ